MDRPASAPEGASLRTVSLLLADISGYTRFLRKPGISLLHAQTLIDLLMRAITAVPRLPLRVSRIVGDAALYYGESDSPSTRRTLIQATGQLLAVFSREQARIDALRICDCSACEGLMELKLKFFAHAGQAVVKDGAEGPDLSGPDVILLHRLQKTPLPWREYVLATASLVTGLDPDEPDGAQRMRRPVQDFGEVELIAWPLARKTPASVRAPIRDRWTDYLHHNLRLELDVGRRGRALPTRYANLPGRTDLAQDFSRVGNLSGEAVIP